MENINQGRSRPKVLKTEVPPVHSRRGEDLLCASEGKVSYLKKRDRDKVPNRKRSSK